MASFIGNIGDTANHFGARAQLTTNLGVNIEFDELEIRDFFWKKWKFDDSFVERANRYDLVIIGGGNFFELWVPNSQTGTSIDISIENLKRIKTPILFYALGVDAGQGVPAENLERFRGFLDYALNSQSCFVSVRNDGALETAHRLLGAEYSSRLVRIPDGGFFFKPQHHSHPELWPGCRHLLVNLAGDMLERRFDSPGGLSAKDSLSEMAMVLTKFLESYSDLRLILIPHIFKDIPVLSSLLGLLPDSLARTRSAMAPYFSGERAGHYLFSLYEKCDLVLGNRFHSNVCAIAAGVPTVGLVNYPQISLLFSDLKLDDRVVDIRKPGFSSIMHSLGRQSLDNPKEVKHRLADVNQALRADLLAGHGRISSWLKSLQVL